ncbi:unnamed protein product [Rodentolepis nana]|uniref:MG2 domain-containing protein n=1 Tax=Rodentolepis nana TaxID=102285 RepID=A0A0R3TFQ5_RODNA|nr:unnamed protein product [Rodentolepis nana]
MKFPIADSEVNRSLHSGEYVLVTFSFSIPAKSISDYKADLFLNSNQYVTLCSPHIVSVGSDLIWRPPACFYKNSSDHPVHQITYDLGNIISIADNNNEIVLGSYLQVKNEKIPGVQSFSVTGRIKGFEQSQAFTISPQSALTLGASPQKTVSNAIKGEYRFEFETPSLLVVRNVDEAYFRIKAHFKPNVHLNDLIFEITFPGNTSEPSHLVAKQIQYQGGGHFQGVTFSNSPSLIKNGTANNSLVTASLSLGPVLNTGKKIYDKNIVIYPDFPSEHMFFYVELN